VEADGAQNMEGPADKCNVQHRLGELNVIATLLIGTAVGSGLPSRHRSDVIRRQDTKVHDAKVRYHPQILLSRRCFDRRVHTAKSNHFEANFDFAFRKLI
jgi:hypothetical protein